MWIGWIGCGPSKTTNERALNIRCVVNANLVHWGPNCSTLQDSDLPMNLTIQVAVKYWALKQVRRCRTRQLDGDVPIRIGVEFPTVDVPEFSFAGRRAGRRDIDACLLRLGATVVLLERSFSLKL